MPTRPPLSRVNHVERLAIYIEIKDQFGSLLDKLYSQACTSDPIPIQEQIKMLFKKCSAEEMAEVLEWLNQEIEDELPW